MSDRAQLTPFGLALGVALIAGSALAESGFQPPRAVAALQSELAIHVPINALGMAGPRIVTAGQRGHILFSDDGKRWTQAVVPGSSDLTAMSFPSTQKGWVVGHEGVVLHSADGGATWSKQLDGARIAELLVKQYGTPANPDDPQAQQLQRDAEFAAAQGADKPLLDVWFEDEQRGFAIGAFNLILRTEDGGKTWAPWLDRIDNPKGLHLYAIRPAGGSVFIVGEQGLVLKLDGAKKRFVAVELPYQGTLFGVVGTPRMTLAFGLRGNAWRSTDGGATWSKVETGVVAGLASGVVRSDGSVVLTSQAGQVLLSTDEGATFRQIAVKHPAPTFAVADAGQGGVALAGYGGVRVEVVR